MISKFWKKYWLTIIGTAIGIIAGFFYWRFIGCNSGSCPITSSPWLSTLWGALTGGLLFNILESGKTIKKQS